MHEVRQAPEGVVAGRFVLARKKPPTETMIDSEPAVLFGTENKLTADGPYLKLLLRLQDVLQRATCLTTVGYSFRDAHVNEQITSFLNGDPSRRIRVIDPAPPVESSYLKAVQQGCGGRCDLIRETAKTGLNRAFPG